MPNGTIQWPRKIFALCVNEFLDMGIARAILESLYVMTHIWCLCWFIFGTDSSISIAMNSKGSDAGKSCNDRLGRYRLSFRAQLLYLAILVKTSLAMCGQ